MDEDRVVGSVKQIKDAGRRGPGQVIITFKVVKEQHGWAIRIGERMMTPFWSRDLAIREANCLADAIRCHGECAEVIVEGADPTEPLRKLKGSSSSRLDTAPAR